MQSEIRVEELASEATRTEMQSEIRVSIRGNQNRDAVRDKSGGVSIRLKRRAVIRED
jgi:hypothetical protein